MLKSQFDIVWIRGDFMVYCVYSGPILFDVDRVCDCIQCGWFRSLKTCFLPRVVIERRTSGKCFCER